MFGPPGTAYLHLNFGVHWCLNAVVGVEGFPAAVLLRAVEPVSGLDAMRERRPGRGERELTSGPGKLARAMGIGPALQRHRLVKTPLWIAGGQHVPDEAVVRTTRVGISRGVDRDWRFYDSRSRFVSRKHRDSPSP